jgi:hypothetical protein
MCARLEGDSPLVEEFDLPLRTAAGRSGLQRAATFGVAQRW